jgi:hypothetical protein
MSVRLPAGPNPTLASKEDQASLEGGRGCSCLGAPNKVRHLTKQPYSAASCREAAGWARTTF